ncbi:hypothetical protein RUM44_005376 [Polyplax serrata]|uniref:Uncharacterized protein n=1 Tax=Polyplax serrata TaxID=468196 RepID=A0ABR1ADD1_POLSC
MPKIIKFSLQEDLSKENAQGDSKKLDIMNPLKRIHIAFCDIGLSPKKKEKPKKNMRKTQMVQLLERTTRGVGKSLNQDVAEKGKCCPPSPSGTSGEEDPFPPSLLAFPQESPARGLVWMPVVGRTENHPVD